ncbi:hypothetical protein OSB04_007234 [Centaurea solstitialis]|uniref:Uncharacterized protein n=1 Tax=Centaurea solstitialis TaxID=347529 RepID=A0AA38TL86_9ASTR|nr:hypothetical protein OSB04_007234 [Centaurea solstitialis]
MKPNQNTASTSTGQGTFKNLPHIITMIMDENDPGQYPMSIVNFAPLNGVNYKKWKEDIDLNLGILDYDHVLKEDPPQTVAECMNDVVKKGIPDSDLAKVYFASIGDKYKVSGKAKT